MLTEESAGRRSLCAMSQISKIAMSRSLIPGAAIMAKIASLVGKSLGQEPSKLCRWPLTAEFPLRVAHEFEPH